MKSIILELSVCSEMNLLILLFSLVNMLPFVESFASLTVGKVGKSRLLLCNDVQPDQIEISSPKIEKLRQEIEVTQGLIASVREAHELEKQTLQQLDIEYGSEIARIKKEFARIKERAVEESLDISNKAKTDALKEVLPITDNYFRAKQLFKELDDGEQVVMSAYDNVFKSFTEVIEGFGVTRVQSVGQPFDFNFMEAIMAAPNTEYKADIVCTEYQIGGWRKHI